jgi:hypothetical protein
MRKAAWLLVAALGCGDSGSDDLGKMLAIAMTGGLAGLGGQPVAPVGYQGPLGVSVTWPSGDGVHRTCLAAPRIGGGVLSAAPLKSGVWKNRNTGASGALAFTEALWLADVPLTEGDNKVDVRVSNTAGESASTTVVLRRESNAAVVAFGCNSSGELGTGAPSFGEAIPTSVLLSDVRKLVGSEYYSLALLNDGRVLEWGKISRGWPSSRTWEPGVPVLVEGLAGVMDIDAGALHSVALLSDGTVRRWHGDGAAPVEIAGISGAIAVAAGYPYVTIALLSDGRVRVATETSAWDAGVDGVAALTRGSLLKQDGSLWSFSADFGSISVSPILLNGVARLGRSGRCAVLTDGTVWTWDYRLVPTQLPLSGVVEVDVNYRNGVALRADGTVWTWGNGDLGQLGNGPTTDEIQAQPAPVAGLTGATSVSLGTCYVLVRR